MEQNGGGGGGGQGSRLKGVNDAVIPLIDARKRKQAVKKKKRTTKQNVTKDFR